ncbi:MAG: right-handed parallel beta-helix repeat-containing protein, partial [Planctomycetota bacterium]
MTFSRTESTFDAKFERVENSQIIGNTIQIDSGTGIQIDDQATGTLIRDNIVTGAGVSLLEVDASSTFNLDSDYNLFWPTDTGTTVAHWQSMPLHDLHSVYHQLGIERHSLLEEPAFIDASSGDFRLTAFSPAIDTGDPSRDAAAEPVPNGGRVNIGAFGGTVDAATSTTSALYFLTPSPWQKLRVGDLLTIDFQALGTQTDRVEVDLTSDDGFTWTNLTTEASLGSDGRGQFEWIIDSALAGFDIRLQLRNPNGNEQVVSSTLHVSDGGTVYFINDDDPNGDTYTSAIGDDRNDGRSPATPMRTLSALLEAYDLSEGDTVYVDAGNYVVLRDIVVGEDDSGVSIIGAGPSVSILNRGTTAPNTAGFRVAGADDVTIEGFSLVGGADGIHISQDSQSQRIRLVDLDVSQQADHGVVIHAGNGVVEVIGSTIHDTTSVFGVGVRSASEGTLIQESDIFGHREGIAGSGRITVADNRIFGNRTGLITTQGSLPDRPFLIENNIVFDNSDYGIRALALASGTLGGTVSGNTVFGHSGVNSFGIEVNSAVVQSNIIHGNRIGLYVTGRESEVRGNRIYNQSQVGVESLGQFLLSSNRIYSNAIGFRAAGSIAQRRSFG